MPTDPDSGLLPIGMSNSRRAAGARQEASLRVQVVSAPDDVEGWTLNMSAGGLRAVFTEHVLKTGDEVEILIGDEPQKRRCRVVWMREQQDGQIAGLEYLGESR